MFQFITARIVCHHAGFQIPVLLTDNKNFLWTASCSVVNGPADDDIPALVIRGVDCLAALDCERAKFVAYVRAQIVGVAALVRSDYDVLIDRIMQTSTRPPQPPGQASINTGFASWVSLAEPLPFTKLLMLSAHHQTLATLQVAAAVAEAAMVTAAEAVEALELETAVLPSEGAGTTRALGRRKQPEALALKRACTQAGGDASPLVACLGRPEPKPTAACHGRGSLKQAGMRTQSR